MRGEKDDVAAEPTVRALLDAFPGAEIVSVRSLVEPAASAPAAALDGPDEDVGYADDDGYTDDDL